MKDNANNEKIFQPFNPFEENNFFTHLKQKKRKKKKHCLVRETNVQCTGHQEHELKIKKLAKYAWIVCTNQVNISLNAIIA